VQGIAEINCQHSIEHVSRELSNLGRVAIWVEVAVPFELDEDPLDKAGELAGSVPVLRTLIGELRRSISFRAFV
jgi:hypothetical protein